MAISKRLRFEVLRRDNHACRYCGRTATETKLTVDHVVPTALGGNDEPGNLAAACRDCNSGKSANTPDAPIVEDVATDALRWARAMQQAADVALANLDRRVDLRGQFVSRWNDWKSGEHTMPMPPGWQLSIDNILAAGLPMDLLRECIDIAMGAPNVHSDNRFRYMCGVAWRRVAEIQEGASRRVADMGQAAELHLSTNQVIGIAIEAIDRLVGHITGDETLQEPAFEVLRDAIQAGKAALPEVRYLGLTDTTADAWVRQKAGEGSTGAEQQFMVHLAMLGIRDVQVERTHS